MTPNRGSRQEWHAAVLDRLLSLKREDESDAAFARRLGLQPQHLSNYRSGRHGLSLRSAVRVARSTGLSLDWLLRGEGEPFRAEAADSGEGISTVRELRRHASALRRKLKELCRNGRIPDEDAARFERTLEEVMEPLSG